MLKIDQYISNAHFFLKQTDTPDPMASPDVVDIVVHRSELFCLHGNGQLSHLSLLSAERCVERLLRRDSWLLAASVCCMFPHTLVSSRVRAPATAALHRGLAPEMDMDTIIATEKSIKCVV